MTEPPKTIAAEEPVYSPADDTWCFFNSTLTDLDVFQGDDPIDSLDPIVYRIDRRWNVAWNIGASMVGHLRPASMVSRIIGLLVSDRDFRVKHLFEPVPF